MNFYPRSPCGERLPEGVKGKAHHSGFLSTLSLRRATLRKFRWVLLVGNFYPRSPCGERPSYSQHVTRPSGYFYPRSPCGERPLAKVRHCEGYVFLSTLSLRRATHEALHGRRFLPISIHALLAESDLPTGGQTFEINLFLSTLSLRRATHPHHKSCADRRYFYPRSPCGERPPDQCRQ